MSKIFFSADLHFNNFNSITYNDRPYKTVEEMDGKLISNINETCSPEDTLYLLGDLCFGNWKYYKPLIKCNVVEIQGNHDRQNKYRFNEFGYLSNYHANNFFLVHDFETFRECIPNNCTVVLAGHCHKAWTYNVIKRQYMHDIPVYNVGVDVNNYRPISLETIIKQLHKKNLL